MVSLSHGVPSYRLVVVELVAPLPTSRDANVKTLENIVNSECILCVHAGYIYIYNQNVDKLFELS